MMLQLKRFDLSPRLISPREADRFAVTMAPLVRHVITVRTDDLARILHFIVSLVVTSNEPLEALLDVRETLAS